MVDPLMRVIGALALCLWASFGAAQDRTALVIGIDSYRFGPDLATPRSDARAIASRLGELGFATFLAENPTQPQLLSALARFRLASAEASTTLIYLAGHGVRWQGDTYVLAADTPFSDGLELLARSVSVEIVLTAVSDRVRNKIVLVDACRDLPHAMAALAQSAITPKRPARAQAGSFVLYSAQPGSPAQDGSGPHSPFAAAVLQALSEPVDLDLFARRVRAQVVAETAGAQIPWSSSSMLTGVVLGGH